MAKQNVKDAGMNKTIRELNEEKWNHDVTFYDFPIGRRVKIVSACVDFIFFDGEIGTVVKNSGNYLGITVKFDNLRFGNENNYTEVWGFNPKDLMLIERNV